MIEDPEQLSRGFVLPMIDALKNEIVNNRISSYEYQFFKNCLINGLQYLEHISVVEFKYVMPHVEMSKEELKKQFPDKEDG